MGDGMDEQWCQEKLHIKTRVIIPGQKQTQMQGDVKTLSNSNSG